MYKYFLWLLGVIIWNYGVPSALPLMDITMAVILKHIFELDKLNFYKT